MNHENKKYRRYDNDKDRIYKNVKFNQVTGCWNGRRGIRKCDGRGAVSFKGEYYLSHQLSYVLFIGPVPQGLCILHHCDNPRCCNPLHLYAGTKQDNANDKVRRNRQSRLKGEINPNSKLSTEDIILIRKLRGNGLKLKEIAERFGITTPMVSYIYLRKSWSHIK